VSSPSPSWSRPPRSFDEELATVLDAADHTSRPVILRIIRDA
jgi:hypothetical protein